LFALFFQTELSSVAREPRSNNLREIEILTSWMIDHPPTSADEEWEGGAESQHCLFICIHFLNFIKTSCRDLLYPALLAFLSDPKKKRGFRKKILFL